LPVATGWRVLTGASDVLLDSSQGAEQITAGATNGAVGFRDCYHASFPGQAD